VLIAEHVIDEVADIRINVFAQLLLEKVLKSFAKVIYISAFPGQARTGEDSRRS